MKSIPDEMNDPKYLEFDDGENLQKLVKNTELIAIASGDGGAAGNYRIVSVNSARSSDSEILPIYASKDSHLSGIATGKFKIWSAEPLSREDLDALRADFPRIAFSQHRHIKALTIAEPESGFRSAGLHAIKEIARRSEVDRVSPEIVYEAQKKE